MSPDHILGKKVFIVVLNGHAQKPAVTEGGVRDTMNCTLLDNLSSKAFMALHLFVHIESDGSNVKNKKGSLREKFKFCLEVSTLVRLLASEHYNKRRSPPNSQDSNTVQHALCLKHANPFNV